MPQKKIYKLGGADPRRPAERIAGMINRAAQPKAIRQQNRQWDDSPTKMAKNRAAAARVLKAQGTTSRALPPRGSKRGK